MKNQFTPKRLLFLGSLTALVFGFIAWQQTTNPPHGAISFTASRGQFHHYIPHVVVMALIVIVADFFALWYGWKRYTREKTTELVTDAADARLNPLREVEPPAHGADRGRAGMTPEAAGSSAHGPSLPRLRGITLPSSLQLERVPIGAVLLTMLASGLGIGWSILDSWPFYGIVAIGLVPWLPLFCFEAAWKYENYGFYAILATFTILQLGHLGEHTAQVIQLVIYDGNLAKSHGVFGNLDLELVHFVWDSGVWLGLLLCAYKLGFRNKWILVSLLFSSLHEVEHMFLFYINRTNLDFYQHGGFAGVMGQHGLIGSPLARPYLHYIYNYFVVVPLVMAFWDESKHAYNVWLAKALPDMTEQERVSVTQQLQRLKANAGDVIVRQGETADRFYIVGDGEVEVIREEADGEKRVALLGPGQFFGEIGLLTAKPRTATVRTTKESELLSLDRDSFLMLVARSTGGAADLDAAMHHRLAELKLLELVSE